jgi:hypothetical protein
MSCVKTDAPCDTGDRPQARTSASLYRGQRIWFEAVSPGPGDPGHPDFITAPKSGEVADVPNERMVLRYLNSISEKYEHQYANWLANDHVSQSDAFVIALNPRRNGTPHLPRVAPDFYPNNPNFDLNRRASPRPYRRAGRGNGVMAAPLSHRQTKPPHLDSTTMLKGSSRARVFWLFFNYGHCRRLERICAER